MLILCVQAILAQAYQLIKCYSHNIKYSFFCKCLKIWSTGIYNPAMKYPRCSSLKPCTLPWQSHQSCGRLSAIRPPVVTVSTFTTYLCSALKILCQHSGLALPQRRGWEVNCRAESIGIPGNQELILFHLFWQKNCEKNQIFTKENRFMNQELLLY